MVGQTTFTMPGERCMKVNLERNFNGTHMYVLYIHTHTHSLTRIGCLIDWKKERRDVSLISEGFPSLASMNLPAIPVPILAVWIPNATRVRPAALVVP